MLDSHATLWNKGRSADKRDRVGLRFRIHSIGASTGVGRGEQVLGKAKPAAWFSNLLNLAQLPPK